MTRIEYLDAAGEVVRTVFAPADEAEAGIHDGEISYRIYGDAATAPATLGIDALRESGRSRIDGAASRARGRYLSAGIGQELTYQAKHAEACVFLRALESGASINFEAWPYVAAEMRATGLSAEDSAKGIAQIGAYWEAVIGPQIEEVRIGGKKSISSMESADQISAHILDVVSALDSI